MPACRVCCILHAEPRDARGVRARGCAHPRFNEISARIGEPTHELVGLGNAPPHRAEAAIRPHDPNTHIATTPHAHNRAGQEHLLRL